MSAPKSLKIRPAHPDPPAHLSAKAAEMWKAMVSDYAMAGDCVGLGLLEAALSAFDRAEEAREILDKEGLTVEGDRGQTKAHPCCAVERDNRAAYIAGIKALRFDVATARPGPGRPPGSGRRF
jgi:P27 family predicted phage terminase small subunit